MIIADRTRVPDVRHGTGTGILMERLVADARAEGVKIIPLCPFVKSPAARHSD
ncbi:MAG: N-acetyltransferase [Marinovum sp.]|nr:N-acetyltransferase [Marinovum sp.]